MCKTLILGGVVMTVTAVSAIYELNYFLCLLNIQTTEHRRSLVVLALLYCPWIDFALCIPLKADKTQNL